MYLLFAIFQLATTFQYDVIRQRTMQKDEPGQLRIDDSGVNYRSANGKTSITLPFIDVREMDVADPSVIRIETYEMLKRKLSGHRSHVFHLRSPRSPEDNDRLPKDAYDFVWQRVYDLQPRYNTAVNPSN